MTKTSCPWRTKRRRRIKMGRRLRKFLILLNWWLWEKDISSERCLSWRSEQHAYTTQSVCSSVYLSVCLSVCTIVCSSVFLCVCFFVCQIAGSSVILSFIELQWYIYHICMLCSSFWCTLSQHSFRLTSITSRPLLSLYFYFYFLQNNPRMASVVANCPSICLSLTKTVFRNALSAESFAKVLSTVLDERKKARKRRQSASRQKLLQAALGILFGALL